MKKFISLILSVLTVFSVCTVMSFADDSGLKIAVASDLHYNIPREELEHTIDDGIFWYANRRAAMDDESGLIIDEFLKQCAESDVEYVLIPGDMADNGRTVIKEHLDVAEKFRKFEAETGKQVFVIDGNHDLGSADTDTGKDDFASIYAEFGYNQALAKTDYDLSYTADLGTEYRLIALDSCDYTKSTEDGMTDEKIEWVLTQAQTAKNDGRYPILMMHHNLLDHLPVQRVLSRNFIIREHFTTAEKFADSGIKIVLTGHEHCSDATSYTSLKGNKIYDFANTALSMYPLQYKVFTLGENETVYETKTVDTIDYDKLVMYSHGFTSEQIDLMKQGLNGYSKLFLKAGVKYRLQLQLTTEKMGIEPSAPYYDIVKNAADRLNELLLTDLYGDDGLQKLAFEKYGIELPDSNYENGWDVVTELVSKHYAGEEAYDIDSTEVTLLLRTVAIVLRDVPPTVLDSAIGSIVSDILLNNGIDPDFTRFIDKGIYDEEYYAKALLSPLLYEFAFDSDDVNDNNGTIEGYGQNNNVKNFFEKIIDFFKKLITYAQMIFNIIPQKGV